MYMLIWWKCHNFSWKKIGSWKILSWSWNFGSIFLWLVSKSCFRVSLHLGVLIFSSLGLMVWISRGVASLYPHIYARAYSWNLENIIYFIFPESIFIIISGWLINLSHYVSVFTHSKVTKINISPFAWNLLDNVTVLLFFVNINAPYQ